MFAGVRRIAVFLAEIELWPVALAVALSIVSARLLPLALGVGGVYWAIRWLAYGVPSVRTPADWGILLLAGMGLVALRATALPEKTFPQVVRLGTGLLLFYTIINWTSTPRRLRLVGWGVLLVGLVLALSAPFSVQWASGKLPVIPAAVYSRFSLLVSDTVHPNVLAGNLVILLPVPLALVLFAWRALRPFERALTVISLAAMATALALTLSRGAWLALGTAGLVLLALRWRRGALAAAAVLGAAAVWFGLHGTADLPGLAGGSPLETLQGRVEIWSRALAMIRDFPLTGIGMGLFGDLADAVYPFFLFPAHHISHAHNLYLQVAVDLGLPGLVAWLAVVLLTCSAAWQVARAGRGGAWLSGFGAGLLCGQVGLLVHGLTDAVTWGMVRPAPLVWALWGLAFAAWKVSGAG